MGGLEGLLNTKLWATPQHTRSTPSTRSRSWSLRRMFLFRCRLVRGRPAALRHGLRLGRACSPVVRWLRAPSPDLHGPGCWPALGASVSCLASLEIRLDLTLGPSLSPTVCLPGPSAPGLGLCLASILSGETPCPSQPSCLAQGRSPRRLEI